MWDCLGGSLAAVTPSPAQILEKIAWLEDLAMEHIALLAYMPEHDQQWRMEAGNAEARVRHLARVSSTPRESLLEGEHRRRVLKRLRIYFSLIREFPMTIRRNANTFRAVFNPCDGSITKREWEGRCAALRRGYWVGCQPAPPVEGERNRDAALARRFLQQQFWVGIPALHQEPVETQRRLMQFSARVASMWHTLFRFPQLFWTLPMPFDTLQSDLEWDARMSAAHLFVHCLDRCEFVKLQALLSAWYHPEIERHTHLVEFIELSDIFTANDVRSQHAVRLICLLHLLSVPLMGSFQATLEKRQWFLRTAMAHTSSSAALRNSLSGILRSAGEPEQTTETDRLHDVLGGSAAAQQEDAEDYMPQVGEAPDETIEPLASQLSAKKTAAKSQPSPASASRSRANLSRTEAAAENRQETAPQEGCNIKEEEAEEQLLNLEDAYVSANDFSALRRRRFMPGAHTSDEDFALFFSELKSINASFQGDPAELQDKSNTILHSVRNGRNK